MEQPDPGSDRDATTEPSDSAPTNGDRFWPTIGTGTRSYAKGQGAGHGGESREARSKIVATPVPGNDDEHWDGEVRMKGMEEMG